MSELGENDPFSVNYKGLPEPPLLLSSEVYIPQNMISNDLSIIFDLPPMKYKTVNKAEKIKDISGLLGVPQREAAKLLGIASSTLR
jgi:hypothetical protein